MKELANTIIHKCNSSVNELLAQKVKRTFENSIKALDEITYAFEFAS
jgi:hypothetical protein